MKMKDSIRLILFVMVISTTGCQYAERDDVADISLSIIAATNKIMVADISHGNMIDPLSRSHDQWDQAFKDCLQHKTIPAELIVVLRNNTRHPIQLYEDWNSTGYENLKFVFWGYGHEYWVTKKAGFWTRNFPSVVTLGSGQCLSIPVAFTNSVWGAIDQVSAQAKDITHVRALYEQHHSPGSCWERDWEDSVSSDYYPAADLLPRFNFSKTDGPGSLKESISIDPDDLKVEIIERDDS